MKISRENELAEAVTSLRKREVKNPWQQEKGMKVVR